MNKENNISYLLLPLLIGGFSAITMVTFFTGEHQISDFNISMYQFILLFILGSVCTSFAFLMGVYIMKFIPAYTVNLSVNMEPIYAIVLALLFFGQKEVMSFNFYVGATVVVGTILLNAYFKKRSRNRIKTKG